jgi:hypothetical protein
MNWMSCPFFFFSSIQAHPDCTKIIIIIHVDRSYLAPGNFGPVFEIKGFGAFCTTLAVRFRRIGYSLFYDICIGTKKREGVCKEIVAPDLRFVFASLPLAGG